MNRRKSTYPKWKLKSTYPSRSMRPNPHTPIPVSAFNAPFTTDKVDSDKYIEALIEADKQFREYVKDNL